MNMVRHVDDSDARDRTMTCIDCGTSFTWTRGEQEFFFAHKFQTPKRCRPCRLEMRERVATRKEQQDGSHTIRPLRGTERP